MQNNKKITITNEQLETHTYKAYQRGLNMGVVFMLLVFGLVYGITKLTEWVLTTTL